MFVEVQFLNDYKAFAHKEVNGNKVNGNKQAGEDYIGFNFLFLDRLPKSLAQQLHLLTLIK